ncbi:MAG: hypothetical protein PHD60_09765, partial [Clostridia bacterium]|nr:hypothetical protein [Clostridia bacterium]
SAEVEITGYSFAEQTGAATINSGAGTIAIEVANGTDVSSLVATFALSEGATAEIGATAQVSATTGNDFTNPVTYTVTAEDGTTTKDWVVTVTEAPSAEVEITGYSFAEQTGAATINSGAGTIAIEVANGTEVSSLVATFALSEGATAEIGATAQVSAITGNDFTNPVTYTVTAEDGTTTKDWVVTVTEAELEVTMVGASWTSGESTEMERLGAGEGTVVVTGGRNDFDSIYPWSEMKLCNVSDDGENIIYIDDEGNLDRSGVSGQVMVKIPKFYYKRTYDEVTKEHQFWIADSAAEGFKVHPAFVCNTEVKEYVLVGAYEGWVDGSGKLASITEKVPTISKTIDEIRPLAQARNVANGNLEWNQIDIQTYSAIQMLYLIEYADMDCQTVIGRGVVDLALGGSDKFIATGSCDSLNGASGMAAGTDGQVAVNYRGVENLWGNVWSWIDGIDIQVDRRPYIADHDFTNNMELPEYYTYVGFDLPGGNGFVTNFSYVENGVDWLMMPSALGGSASTYVSDHYNFDGNRVVMAGGDYHSKSIAGVFNWYVNNSLFGVYNDDMFYYMSCGSRTLAKPS